jgi:hypothetical protein
VQGQYQWGEADATLKVGAPNEDPGKSFGRIGLRRARIRATHEEGLFAGAVEVELLDKGVFVKDVYCSFKDPWQGWFRLQAGIFTRPFGYELSCFAFNWESPERSLACQTLLPEEKDMGVMLQIQPTDASPWSFLKFSGGWFAGNGVKMETDSRRDFIGHLSADKDLGRRIRLSGGFSYYNGSVYQGTETVFRPTSSGFVADVDPANQGKFSVREYFGIDAQIRFGGGSQLRAEYSFGRQPGSLSSSKSPNESALPAHDVYNRDFAGGYLLFVQQLGKSPLSAVLKYDWYDPNTAIEGNAIGFHHSGSGDVAFRHFGGGVLWWITSDVRIQAYYEVNRNETTERLAAYSNDLRDNAFTLRLQYRF